MSLTSTVNTVQTSSTITQQSTINNNNTQEINSAIANQSATAEPQPSSSHFDVSPLREDPNFYLANLRSKSGTHEFHALNVQTHTGSYFSSPSPCYPLRVDSQGSEKRLKLSSSEQNNQLPPSASRLQLQQQHSSPPTPLSPTTTLPHRNYTDTGSDIDMNITTTQHHLQAKTSSRGQKTAD